MNLHLRGFPIILATILATILAVGAPALANTPSGKVGIEERVRLQDASDPGLGTMRAGRDQGTKSIQDSERSTLRSAEATSPELGEMRGGDAVTILLLVAVVLLILILI